MTEDLAEGQRAMNVVQICVAKPEDIELDGKKITTSIFKRPVNSNVFADYENLHGDGQADLTAHGGADKALYFYSQDYYPIWASELGRPTMEDAQFGENLTVTGCRDEEVVIGSRLRIGAVEVTVTQPRIPCFKLGIRIADVDFPNRFWMAGRLGFYARVEKKGFLKRGDSIDIVDRPSHDITVHELWRMVITKNSVGARRAQERLADLDEGWQRRLRRAIRG